MTPYLGIVSPAAAKKAAGVGSRGGFVAGSAGCAEDALPWLALAVVGGRVDVHELCLACRRESETVASGIQGYNFLENSFNPFSHSGHCIGLPSKISILV